jgi:hypothetical protein
VFAPNLIAKTDVAAADALFVAGTYGETHEALKASCAAALMITSPSVRARVRARARANGAWGHAGRVVIKINVDGGVPPTSAWQSYTYYSIASGVLSVKTVRGAREGCSRLAFAGTVLYTTKTHGIFFLLARGNARWCSRDGPLAVQSRTTLLDLLRYAINFDITLVTGQGRVGT